MKNNASRLLLIIGLCVCMTAVATRTAIAREKPWYKYENAYFEAYSDASEKKVRQLLTELENFRSAIVQVTSLEMPDRVVKTQILIFDSTKSFRNITKRNTIAAFAMAMDGVPYLVMTDNGGKKAGNITIRHEYTHILLAYNGHRYPAWYQEGFAEFMSGTRFRRNGTEFTLGEIPGRVRAPAKLTAWDELIADDFDLHAIGNFQVLSNAYLQSWLMVHYLTLGDELAHTDKLNTYLALYAKGVSSADAFAAAFSSGPGDIGQILESGYGRKVPSYTVAFRPGVQDHEFSRSPANNDSKRETIERMTTAFNRSTE